MAFCIYCGKKLEEGEICNCQSAQDNQAVQGDQEVHSAQNSSMGEAPQPAGGQMTGQAQEGVNQAQQINLQQYQDSFNQAKRVSGAYLKRLLGVFIGVLRNPVQSGKEFVATGDAKLGVGFWAVQAIVSGIFALIICSKVNSIGKVATSALSRMKDEEAQNILSYPKAFLLTIIGSLIISLAIAILLYLGAKLFQGKTTFGHVICIVSVRSVEVSVLLALSIVVLCLNVVWGFVIFILSWLVGLVFMIPVIEAGVEFNTDRLPYMVAIVAILSLVVIFAWMKFSLPLYVPSELKEQVEEMMEQIKGLGTLSSLF